MWISLALHAAALGAAFALVSKAPEAKPAARTVLTVNARQPLIEPEQEPEVQTLPPLEVVSEVELEPALPEPPDPALLPDPEPHAPLLAAPRPRIRVTTRMFQRPLPKPVVKPQPLPPVEQPVAVPVTAKPPQPVKRAPRVRARDLRPQSVPPVMRYYPRELRARGVEGRVMVKVTVSARGFVVDAQVLTSSGHRAFDRAALRLVRDTRFVAPGSQAQAKLPITFRLR